jgi:hypothetical protein
MQHKVSYPTLPKIEQAILVGLWSSSSNRYWQELIQLGSNLIERSFSYDFQNVLQEEVVWMGRQDEPYRNLTLIGIAESSNKDIAKGMNKHSLPKTS